MKYNLSRQLVGPEIKKILVREIRKQKIDVPKVTKKDLKEMAQVTEAIKKSGLPKHFVCKKLPHNLGRGIFLHPRAKPILKGEVIAPYAGEIALVPQNAFEDGSYAFTPVEEMILSKDEQQFFDPKQRYHPGRLYLFLVDASKKGNFTRFINHSEKPNVIAHQCRVPSNSYDLDPMPIEVIYFAKKTIHPGDQLLVSYEGEGRSYWGASKTKPFPLLPNTFKI